MNFVELIDKRWNQIWISLRNISIILLLLFMTKWVFLIPEKDWVALIGVISVISVYIVTTDWISKHP